MLRSPAIAPDARSVSTLGTVPPRVIGADSSPLFIPFPGRYGSSTGLSSSLYSGTCTAGYFCPVGSTPATQQVRIPLICH